MTDEDSQHGSESREAQDGVLDRDGERDAGEDLADGGDGDGADEDADADRVEHAEDGGAASADGGTLDALRFDRADDAAPVAACARCAGALAGEYYEADGNVMCSPCVRVLRYGEPGDSAFARVARAAGLGIGAAVVSGVVWWGIREATGWEIGLIAVAVGLAVGFAVRIGARGMGGWFYQALAVLLTYLSITSTYVPALMEAIQHPDTVEAPSDEGIPVATEPTRSEPRAPTWLAFLIACLFAPAMPFLMGFENILGIAIIAFALWEAWRVNKRPVKNIVGPYALAEAESHAA